MKKRFVSFMNIHTYNPIPSIIIISIILVLAIIAYFIIDGNSQDQIVDMPLLTIRDETFRYESSNRRYKLFIPPGRITGLMVVLHGSGESMNDIISSINLMDSRIQQFVKQEQFLVVVPEGKIIDTERGWVTESADDANFINALVESLKTQYTDIVPKRSFVFGFSNGGELALLLACSRNNFRGVGVVGNYYNSGCSSPSTGQPVPGWFGAGIDDEIVRISSMRSNLGQYLNDLTGCSNLGSLQTVSVPGMPNGVTCKEHQNCNKARLCEWQSVGHAVPAGSLSAAWNFLKNANDSLSSP
jgi:poly(3-hydroxybutyrate) depolymerase